VAEVENKRALQRLLYNTALHKLDYKIIHFESPDPRGIDVALLYRTSTLKRIRAKPCHLYGPDSTVLRTRDILLAEFERPGGTPVAFLVNHHPSKYGGASVSEARRAIAVGRMKQLADSLQAAGIEYIVAMGDFNDTPANPVYKRLEPTLRNLAEPLYQKGLGTIKYDGAWELIDLFFVSPKVQTNGMEIITIPFLQTADGGHAGRKPLRTYSGPRYIGGVSDHCPIWLEIPRLRSE
jgi:endonuclease/exonuclease/phosphatase family metal-dependent hydrolase